MAKIHFFELNVSFCQHFLGLVCKKYSVRFLGHSSTMFAGCYRLAMIKSLDLTFFAKEYHNSKHLFYICRIKYTNVEYEIITSRRTIDGIYLEMRNRFYERHHGTVPGAETRVYHFSHASKKIIGQRRDCISTVRKLTAILSAICKR